MVDDRRGEIGGRRENRGTQVHWKRFCVGPIAPPPWGLRWFHVWHNVNSGWGASVPRAFSPAPWRPQRSPEGLS